MDALYVEFKSEVSLQVNYIELDKKFYSRLKSWYTMHVNVMSYRLIGEVYSWRYITRKLKRKKCQSYIILFYFISSVKSRSRSIKYYAWIRIHDWPMTSQIGAAWRNEKSVDGCQSWVRAPAKAPIISLSKTFYPYCLYVLVGSRNGFERALHRQTFLVSQSN